jgi:dTDP-glucose 4,6-dehydratase
MTNLLVTGGAGFIGSNLVRYLMKSSDPYPRSFDFKITVLDSLTYAGNLKNLEGLTEQITFVKGDVCNAQLVELLVSASDYVIHLAAESHVDRSISGPRIFIDTNIVGTFNILESVQNNSKRMILVSTDEVYGSIATGFADENYPLIPSSPYSASKASADLLALSYFNTFSTDVSITRCSNNYGPNQYPEKLIPLSIHKLLNNQKVPVYGTGQNIRDWIHVEDHCAGLLLALTKGVSGRVYNFGEVDHVTNLEIIEMLISLIGASKDSFTFVEDRLGHDFRYAVNASRARQELGWQPTRSLREDLTDLIDWYKKSLIN